MSICRLFFLAIALALLGTTAVNAQKSACPADMREFPPAAPEQVGMNSGMLAMAVQELRSADKDVHGLIVLRDCRMIFELYTAGVTREHNHAVYSVTKSVVATLAGTLMKSGRLPSLDASISDLIGKRETLDPAANEKARRIRLKHVMAMASGLDYHHQPHGHPIYRSEDRFRFALTPAFVAEPDARFNYSDGDASIAGAAIAAAADRDLLSYAKTVLFDPLGFKNVEWWYRDAAGRYPGGWALRLRTIDMAKLGQLYLQRGRWQDKTILDPSFIDLAWSPSHAASFYGLFWWRWEGNIPTAGPVYYANGFKGQRVFVLPRHRIIVALNANLSGVAEKSAFPVLVRQVAMAVKSNGPLSRTTQDEKQLAEQLARPFTGKPGTLVLDQDVPRPPRN